MSLIHDNTVYKIREFVQHSLSGGSCGNVFFRRIERVDLHKTHPVTVRRWSSPDSFETLETLRGIPMCTSGSGGERDRYIQTVHHSFTAYTTPMTFDQDEPIQIKGKRIRLPSSSHGEFNIDEFKYMDSPCVATPIKGDLVCICMSQASLMSIPVHKSKTTPTVNMCWFVCSEQFKRAWNMVMYHWDETFDRMIPKNTSPDQKENALRKKMFCGNRLMTNSCRKAILAREQSGDPMTKEEIENAFWFRREEKVSLKWVDVYAAIVLMSRYGELPGPTNVPNNVGTTENPCPKRTKWDLPDEFVSNLIMKATNNDVCVLDFKFECDTPHQDDLLSVLDQLPTMETLPCQQSVSESKLRGFPSLTGQMADLMIGYLQDDSPWDD